MRQMRKGLQINHFLKRITDNLGIYADCPVVDCSLHGIQVAKVAETRLDAVARESLAQQQPGVAEKMVGSDYVGAALAE